MAGMTRNLCYNDVEVEFDVREMLHIACFQFGIETIELKVFLSTVNVKSYDGIILYNKIATDAIISWYIRI